MDMQVTERKPYFQTEIAFVFLFLDGLVRFFWPGNGFWQQSGWVILGRIFPVLLVLIAGVLVSICRSKIIFEDNVIQQIPWYPFKKSRTYHLNKAEKIIRYSFGVMRVEFDEKKVLIITPQKKDEESQVIWKYLTSHVPENCVVVDEPPSSLRKSILHIFLALEFLFLFFAAISVLNSWQNALPEPQTLLFSGAMLAVFGSVLWRG